MASRLRDNAALVAGDDDLPEGIQKKGPHDGPFVQRIELIVYVVGMNEDAYLMSTLQSEIEEERRLIYGVYPSQGTPLARFRLQTFQVAQSDPQPATISDLSKKSERCHHDAQAPIFK